MQWDNFYVLVGVRGLRMWCLRDIYKMKKTEELSILILTHKVQQCLFIRHGETIKQILSPLTNGNTQRAGEDILT